MGVTNRSRANTFTPTPNLPHQDRGKPTGNRHLTNRHPPNTPPEPEYATLTLEGMAPLGDCYARFEGETINVFGGLPREEVVARIVRYRRRRRKFVSAIVHRVIAPSPHRVAPPCPLFGPCSGCQWQHVSYDHQLALKRDAVAQELALYPELDGVPVAPTLPAPQPFNYRNHARFTVRRGGSLGFTNRITRRFVRVEECMLMAEGVNDALAELQGKCAETTQLSVRYGINTGDFLVQPTLQNPAIGLPSGQTHYIEKLSGREFRVASPSFFQVNTRQAERMAQLVRERLELTDTDTLLDAYAGVGTFAILLADTVGRVIAVEESAAAVRDAARNAEGVANLEFVEAKTEHALDTLAAPVDAVILDPPRAGCHPDVLSALARAAPRRAVYVSCEPSTLARDLAALAAAGMSVQSVEPLDMFPQTHHVEAIATIDG